MKNLKTLLIIVLFAIGIGALAYIIKTISFREIMNSFMSAKLEYIIGYLVVSVLMMVFFAWRWQIILKSQGLKIPFHRVFNYRIIGYGISYFTPSAKFGGEPVRAMLLSHHKVKFSKALSSVIIDKTIEMTSLGVFFIFGVFTALFTLAMPMEAEVFLIVFATICLAGIIVIYERLIRGKGFIKQLFVFFRLHKMKKLGINVRKVEVFEERIITFFKHNKSEFLITLGISLITFFLTLMEFKFALLIMGFNVSFTNIFLIVTFIGASLLIPIPLALGSMEAGQALIMTLINLKSSTGVAVSLLTRARDIVWCIISLFMLSYYGLNPKMTIKSLYEKKDMKKF